MRPALILLLATFMGAGGCTSIDRQSSVGAGTVDQPIVTTIQAVRAAPAQYHHKFIQLRGLIDACTPWGCDLLAVEPGTIPAKTDFRDRILHGIQFDFVPAPGSPPEQTGTETVDRSTDLMQELYRFTEVTLVGEYDAACALGYDPKNAPPKGKPRDEIICLDHHGDLQVYRVLTVHKRWPASAGALWGHKNSALSPLPLQLAERLFTSFKVGTLMVNPDLDEWEAEYRAFADAREQNRDILCICRAKTCEGKWPSEADDLVRAPANPYQCTIGIRTKTGWRFPPAWFE